MVEGLSTGFTKTLTMIGVGYRGLVDGKTLTLNLGYSNPVLLPIPEGIEVQVQSREHDTWPTWVMGLSPLGVKRKLSTGDVIHFCRWRRQPPFISGDTTSVQSANLRPISGLNGPLSRTRARACDMWTNRWPRRRASAERSSRQDCCCSFQCFTALSLSLHRGHRLIIHRCRELLRLQVSEGPDLCICLQSGIQTPQQPSPAGPLNI